MNCTPPPEPREPAAREAEFDLNQRLSELERLSEAGECTAALKVHALIVAYSAELRAERDEAQRLAQELMDNQLSSADFRILQTRAEASERSLLQARASLRKYGQHDPLCKLFRISETTTTAAYGYCSCGLEALLASTSAPEGTV